MWSTAIGHENNMAPCYQVEYANSDRIEDFMQTIW